MVEVSVERVRVTGQGVGRENINEDACGDGDRSESNGENVEGNCGKGGNIGGKSGGVGGKGGGIHGKGKKRQL